MTHSTHSTQDIVQDADKDECFAVCFLLPPNWQLANKLALSLPRLKCHHHTHHKAPQATEFLLLLARTAAVLWVRRPKNILVKWNSRLSPFAIHMGHLLSPLPSVLPPLLLSRIMAVLGSGAGGGNCCSNLC